MTTDKLRVLVRVDLDCASAQIATQGHVTSKSVHDLYDVMKRANSLTAGMTLELERTRRDRRKKSQHTSQFAISALSDMKIRRSPPSVWRGRCYPACCRGSRTTL